MTEQNALDSLCRQLDAHVGVNDWVVRRADRAATQLYLIGAEPEAQREVVGSDFDVTIYHDQGDGRGEASFKLSAGQVDQFDTLLDEAVFMAGLSLNPHFTLPAPATSYPAVPLADPQLATAAQAQATAAQLRAELAAAMAGETGVRLSSFELFLERADMRQRSSNGSDVSSSSTHATLEMTLVARNEQGEESEAFSLIERRRAADFGLPALVKRQSGYARDSLRARLPRTGAAAVAIDAEAMLPFFAAVGARASAAARYRGSTSWEPGQPIDRDLQPGAFDPLMLTCDATLPYGLRSRAFDEETLPGLRFTLIEDGILQRYWATTRYAQYLGVEPTGEPGNIILAPGPGSAAQLLTPPDDAPLYHVVTFSWLTPDRVTGDFSGEIRLGYEITSSGITPIRGGAISGNAFSGLTHAHFSRETEFLGDYQGPSLARFATFNVAGE